MHFCYIIFQVKSGFLQEEDVRIVSKQIKDRITQVRLDLVGMSQKHFCWTKNTCSNRWYFK